MRTLQQVQALVFHPQHILDLWGGRALRYLSNRFKHYEKVYSSDGRILQGYSVSPQELYPVVGKY